MDDSIASGDLLSTLAHEIAQRYRLGEQPSVSEYAQRYPQLADEIRELFPALLMMEQLDSTSVGCLRRARILLGVDHAA